MAKPHDIYRFLTQQGTVSTLSEKWKGFRRDPAFFDLPDDREALIGQLQEAFEQDELLEARVLAIGEDGAVTLNRRLSANPSFIFVPHGEADLVAGGVSIRHEAWGWPTVLADPRTVSRLERTENRLPMTFASSDMAALWRMGLPAAPATALDIFGGKQIDTFCELLNVSRRQDDDPQGRRSLAQHGALGEVDDGPIVPVLVNWSPEQLDLADPPRFDAVRQHLLNLARFLRIPLDTFAVWKPTPDELKRLRWCLRYGRGTDIRIALQDSMQNSRELLDRTPVPRRPASPTYIEVAQEWVAAESTLGPLGSRDCRQQAWDRVQEHLNREVIGPLTELILETTDPLERSQFQTLVELSQMAHPQALQLAAQYSRSIRERGTQAAALIPTEALQQFLAQTDRILDFTRELTPWRCKQKPKRAPLRKSKPKISTQFSRR